MVKKGSFRNAVIELEKSVAADASYGNAHYVLGISYKALNEYDKAINSFAAAHALGTKPEQSAKALGQLYQKAALNSFGKRNTARLSTILTKRATTARKAPNPSTSWALPTVACTKKTKPKWPLPSPSQPIPPTPGPTMPYGDIQRLSRDYGKAIVTYQRSIEADPTYMESYGDLARLKFDTQDIESVVPLLQNALKIDDTYAEGHRLLGIALNQLGRFPRGHCPAEQGRRSRRRLLRDALPAQRGSLRHGQLPPSH